jgi:uncharacterized membrane protein (DUF373 family)
LAATVAGGWVIKRLERLLYFIETAESLLLGLLAALAALSVVAEAVHPAPRLASSENVLHVLDGLLLLFIVIELFRMSMALMKDQNVLLAALEMVVVALARKLVAVESSEDLMPKVVALAISSGTWALIVWRTRAGLPAEGGRSQN